MMDDARSLYADAINALNQGQWSAAATRAAHLLRRMPRHGGVHFIAGVAALQMRQLPMALAHLRQAVALNATRPDYGAQLARALATAHLLTEAVAVAEAALAMDPQDALTLDTLGVVLTQATAHVTAAEAFRRAVNLLPQRASYRFNLATSLTFAGDLEGACAEYEACLALEPTYWKAHLALAQLRRQREDSNHLGRLRTLLETWGKNRDAQLYLNLAIAKELEDLDAYAEAFAHYTAGKRAGRRASYRPEQDEKIVSALIHAFPVEDTISEGHPSEEPIFVVGMPRSGTTLVDRILSSHPQVHSAGELQNFPILLKRFSGSRTSALLDSDTVARSMTVDWARLGKAFVASTRPGTGGVPRFVDKLPHNFLRVGHIARALPNARIICLRREPLDTCLGNFRQLFAQVSPEYDYSFDLLDTGRYFIQFDRLMAHWHRVFPGRIHELRYEALVQDQEVVSRALLAYCGLPWDPTCLKFEGNPSPVATASAVQVREPLHTRALGRWQRYRQEIEPLRALFEDAGILAGRAIRTN